MDHCATNLRYSRRLSGWYGIKHWKMGPQTLRLSLTEAEGSLLSIAVQEVFGTFVSSILKVFQDIGTVDIVQKETGSFYLRNLLVTLLAKMFTDNQLGSESDVFLCMLTALVPRMKGSPLQCAVDAASKSAAHHKQQGEFGEAESVLKWALSQLGRGEKAGRYPTALGELYREALRKPETRQFGLDGIGWLHLRITGDTRGIRGWGASPESKSTLDISITYTEVACRYIPGPRNCDRGNILAAIEAKDLVTALVELTSLELIREEPDQTIEALLLAAENGWPEIVSGLLELCPILEEQHADRWHRRSLCNAIESGSVATVNVLLQSGVVTGVTDIAHASRTRKIHLLESLLSVTNSYINYNPLLLAVHANCVTIAENLLDQGADIHSLDSTMSTPLHIAAAAGYVRMAKMLLHRGAKVDLLNMDNSTALHCAGCKSRNSRNSCYRPVQEVHGHFKGSYVSTEGKDIFQIAQEKAVPDDDLPPAPGPAGEGKYAAITEILVDHGAHTDVINNLDHTPLQTASVHGNEPVVKVLLGRDANVNTVTEPDGTALHCATSQAHESIVRLLLDHGADLHVKDFMGRTPLRLSEEVMGGPGGSIWQMLYAKDSDLQASAS
ncbi:ankyrin repeat-containing domain protein [Aspergillus multicolor]|uniref:ankyrin repeat-containing domain protein n=1 Tax=Aspergillus multicolor TaxID=41759 RepID=UPI003CCD5EDA